ncbi:hypothetical protein ACFLZP_04490 [Patescibacteria group bacterium]
MTLRKKVNQLISQSVIQSCKGYVALASVLVIAAVVLVISVSVSLLSVSEGQMSLAGKKNEETVDLVEGCLEEALLRLNEEESIPATISLPEGDCSVTINSQVGNDWTITVSTTFENYTKSIQAVVNRETTVAITSWQEIE